MSVSVSKKVDEGVIRPRQGVAFRMKAGEFLKVIDPEGEQVADLFCVDAQNHRDALSSGRTIDYNDTIRLTQGHYLYSNSGNIMFEITEDSCGIHDFLVAPCSLQMFRMLDSTCVYHPSCQENLTQALAQFGVAEELITTTFNIFMNVPVQPDGRIRVEPPRSKPGDTIVLRTYRDLIVGLTACSDEGTNHGVCKPIQYSVL